MRISLIAPILDSDIYSDLGYLARQLQHTGVRVRIYLTPGVRPAQYDLEAIAPVSIVTALQYEQDDWLMHSDLYIYICAGSHPWLDSARTRERGAVALFLPRPRSTSTGTNASLPTRPAQDSLLGLAPYADLLFLSASSIKQELIDRQLCQPERIYTLPDPSETTPTDEDEGAYRFTLSCALSQVATWTPLRDWSVQDQTASRSTTSTASPRTMEPSVLPENLPAPFSIALAQLRSSATVTLPKYEIRSPTPVVGPLIAWIRRNLTSHLQKPYFDPILQSQERFNWQAIQALEAIAQQLAEQRQRHASATEKSVDLSSNEPAAERQRRLTIAARRMLHIVQSLETELQNSAEQTRPSAYAALRVELQEILADLESLSSSNSRT